MRTLKILALTCLLVAPTFAEKKQIIIGQITKPTFNEIPGKSSIPQSSIDAELAAARTTESLVVKVLTPIKHQVRKGDNLSRIARRYRVTVDEIRSQEMNPNLVARKNKNLLRRGETINIPVYRVVNRIVPSEGRYRGFAKLGANDIVVINPQVLEAKDRALEAKDRRIQRLENSVGTARKWIIGYGIAFLAFVILSILLGYTLVFASRENQLLNEKLAEAHKNTAGVINAAVGLSNTGTARELI